MSDEATRDTDALLWFSVREHLFYHLSSYWHLCNVSQKIRKDILPFDDGLRPLADQLAIHLTRHKRLMDTLCAACGVSSADVDAMMEEVYADFREDMRVRAQELAR